MFILKSVNLFSISETNRVSFEFIFMWIQPKLIILCKLLEILDLRQFKTFNLRIKKLPCIEIIQFSDLNVTFFVLENYYAILGISCLQNEMS